MIFKKSTRWRRKHPRKHRFLGSFCYFGRAGPVHELRKPGHASKTDSALRCEKKGTQNPTFLRGIIPIASGSPCSFTLKHSSRFARRKNRLLFKNACYSFIFYLAFSNIQLAFRTFIFFSIFSDFFAFKSRHYLKIKKSHF